MSLFAIGDLHLSFGTDKPMDIFGQHWVEHYKKIEKNWKETVTQEDTVLIAGDISWALRLEQVKPDLDFVQSLPGKKILIAGNHDYWWSSTAKIQSLYQEMKFIRNDFDKYGDIAICGSRGWLCPNDMYYMPQDEKIYKREQIRLKNSIESALRAGYQKIVLLLHFPPTNDKKENSAFLELIHQYPEIKWVVYGHLHGETSFHTSIEGNDKGVEYYLVSCDYLDFKLLKIL